MQPKIDYRWRDMKTAPPPLTYPDSHPEDLFCSICGRNMGHSAGKRGLLKMHLKWGCKGN